MHIPQGHRVGLWLVIQPGHAGNTLGDLALRRTGGAEATQVTFDIGREYRHTGIAESLDQTLQGHRFAGTGCARDQPVTVGQAQRLPHRLPITASTQYKLRNQRHLAILWVKALLQVC